MNSISIFSLSREDLLTWLSSLDQPSYRADQIWKGVHFNLWNKIDQFTPLPIALRSRIAENFSLSNLTVRSVIHSKDKQTQKVLFMTPDQRPIETVLMRYESRNALCVSTQSGCPIGCVFCATGQMGFLRNLNSGEIIEQIYHFARSLREEEAKITNIVFMGMGEPLLNYDEVCSAIHLLNDRKGFDFGLRRNTISTSGIIPGIYRMAEEHSQVNLAISLHTVNDALRTSLMPINKKYPIKDLFSACWAYTELTGRRITFEYALISGVNDSVEDARELVKSIRNRLCHVNLIPLNPTLGYRGVGSVSDQVQKFKLVLEEAQIPVSVRLRRGIEIQAGCGQLASQQN